MKIVTQDVRKLTVTGGTTYYVTIPYEMIRQLGWKKGEKKVIKIDGEQVIIADWKDPAKDPKPQNKEIDHDQT